MKFATSKDDYSLYVDTVAEKTENFKGSKLK